jgi:rRNA-processing protein FCF1
MKFYLDTCIWLNLFKKEISFRGAPYWKFAEDFIGRNLKSGNKIMYSGMVLKELKIKLNKKEYKKQNNWIEKSKFTRITVLQEDKDAARKLESKYFFEISYYDLVHLSICKRLNLILITRDRELIEIAKENQVKVSRPEDIIIKS